MDEAKVADSAVVTVDDTDPTDATDIDVTMEKLEKEAVEVNVRVSS
jgi:hypothetical protein